MEPGSVSRKREIVAALAVLLFIVVVVGAVTVANKKKSSGAASTAPASTAATSNQSAANTNATYKDGSYTSVGSYDSPGGQEQITVSVTLKNGVVTDTSAKSGANDPDAAEYQDQFISGYKQSVVGKKLADISLSRVSGSSLTSQGFNDAIQKIRANAQS